MTTVQDAVFIPDGPGVYSGPGFSASIGTGDVVVVRIGAPANHRFRLNDVQGTTGRFFGFNFWWSTGAGDILSNAPTATVTFEGGNGSAPANTYSLCAVSDNGNAVLVDLQYNITGSYEFTAIRVEFTVGHALADIMRDYGPVTTFSYPAFTAIAFFSGNNPNSPIVLAIEPLGHGACCTGSACTVTLPGDCPGVFLGSGSSCTPAVIGGTINPCCPADFDGQNGLGVPDIFAFLSAWFAGCP